MYKREFQLLKKEINNYFGNIDSTISIQGFHDLNYLDYLIDLKNIKKNRILYEGLLIYLLIEFYGYIDGVSIKGEYFKKLEIVYLTIKKAISIFGVSIFLENIYNKNKKGDDYISSFDLGNDYCVKFINDNF